jgi:hypothetical protein
MATVSQLFDTDQWLGCPPNSANPAVPGRQDPARRRRQTREQAGVSKTGLWGPTHSLSSGEDDDDDESSRHKPKPSPAPVMTATGWMASFTTSSSPFFKTPTKTNPPLNHSQQTDSTKSTSASSRQSPVVKEITPSPTTKPPTGATPIAIPTSLERMWYTAQTAFSCKEDTTITDRPNNVFQYVEEVCSPCEPRNLYSSGHEEDGNRSISLPDDRGVVPTGGRTWPNPLGIMRLEAPGEEKKEERSVQHAHSTPRQAYTTTPTSKKVKPIQSSDRSTTSSQQTPAERRRQRHYQRQQRSSASLMELTEEVEVTPDTVVVNVKQRQRSSPSKQPRVITPQPLPLANAPVESFTLVREDAQALERSISELTMKSYYGEATAMLGENRRMAYYAVGRHHRNSGRGGNRRCYFTGKLILGGSPFYAGSVQQGLRTLVVFCLPSAIGLPKDKSGSTILRNDSLNSGAPSSIFDEATATRRMNGTNNNTMTQPRRPSILTMSRRPSGISKVSSARSVDDSTVDEDMDPNWGMDREYLLRVLPEPTQSILDAMATLYPAQFDTLPVQVRSPHCWRLYVKFCFFSGLPIAEGECHYKCRDEICLDYGEEIILSHEVMEAVNGESAEILKLPNLKTFRYLRKHYNQQSGKLPAHVFQRETWEMVRAEI